MQANREAKKNAWIWHFALLKHSTIGSLLATLFDKTDEYSGFFGLRNSMKIQIPVQIEFWNEK